MSEIEAEEQNKKKEHSEQEETLIDAQIHNTNAMDITQLQTLMDGSTSDSLIDSLSNYLSNPDNVIKSNNLTLSAQIGNIIDGVTRIRARTKIITDTLSKPENITNDEISNIVKEDYEAMLNRETGENVRIIDNNN